jgi:hypothetical protein
LGQWWAKYEKELEPGLWKVVVSGKLPFEQDFVFSKLVEAEDVGKVKPRDDDPDDGNINGDLVLLRREIINGVITADILRTILATATNAERRAWLALELVTAAAYLKGDRHDDADSWARAVMADRGALGDPLKPGDPQDKRTHAWLAVPLVDFVTPLLAARKQQKARSKDSTLLPAERAAAEALSNTLKLFVNTLYGCLATKFFHIGNAIVVDNITARGRVGVWMLAKALGLCHCVTDGGLYEPAAVNFFAGPKPGLAALARMSERWKGRGRTRGALGGREWDGVVENLPPLAELDALALGHVNAFWGPYGLTLPFAVEHKAEEVEGAQYRGFQAAGYWSKADYGVLLPNGDIKYKVRGKDKTLKAGDAHPHPKHAIIRAAVEGRDEFPTGEALNYTHAPLLKIRMYKRIQASAGYGDDEKDVRPGDRLPAKVRTARFNNTHFALADAADYLRRRNRKKKDRCRDVQWFEKYGAQGTRYVLQMMEQDDLRRPA